MKTIRKHLISVLLIVVVLVSLSACGSSGTAESSAAPVDVSSGADTAPVDLDLTVLSSTMVYSEVYNMLYFYPEDYYGKTVKMAGQFNVYQWVDESGVVADMPVAYACIISDATACCAEGMEFVLKDDLAYPDDYPELGTEITVIGEFQSYEENGMTWYHLVNARLA